MSKIMSDAHRIRFPKVAYVEEYGWAVQKFLVSKWEADFAEAAREPLILPRFVIGETLYG